MDKGKIFKIELSRWNPLGANPSAGITLPATPYELADALERAGIAGEIPAHIGILAYFEGERQYGLRQFKPAEWQEVSDQTKVLLLYNAMKKWCDGAVFV